MLRHMDDTPRFPPTARVGPLTPDEVLDALYDPLPPARASEFPDHLVRTVGSADALAVLDSTPIPDELFDWSAVEERDRPFVAAVLALSDQCCEALLDVEFRTIARRILARVAARDPRCLRRASKPERTAGALVYLSGRGSGVFGRRGRPSARHLWGWWGITSCADRARTLYRAAGFASPADRWDDEGIVLGEATLLHSTYRAHLCRVRDYSKELAPRPRWVPAPDGRHAQVRAVPARAVVACRAAAGSRSVVMIGLGRDLEDASFYALPITEARELVRIVEHALAAPVLR